MRKLVVPALVALSALYIAPQASAQNAAAPTFNKDVAPISRIAQPPSTG
jgi:hypothetical protein